MWEPFFGLMFRYFFHLDSGRLDLNRGDLSWCRIYPDVGNVFLTRPRNVDRPDQHSVFLTKLDALDRAVLNFSQRNFLSLMLRHARLLKQFRLALLRPQIEGCPARGECQCDDRSPNWLHTNFGCWCRLVVSLFSDAESPTEHLRGRQTLAFRSFPPRFILPSRLASQSQPQQSH